LGISSYNEVGGIGLGSLSDGQKIKRILNGGVSSIGSILQ